MKNMFKYISLSLCAFVVSFSAFADGDGDSGVVASKKARNNYDGTYTLELEAFVKGQNVTVHSEKPVPVNAVLVLDVSGSMSTSMGSGSEYLYTPQQYDIATFYNLNQGTYYFQLDNGTNASFVVSGWSGATNSTSQTKTGTLTVNGQEYVLSVTRTRRNSNSNNWTYPTVDPSPISSHVGGDKTIYSYSYRAVQRIDALKTACKTFVTNMYNNANNWNVEHPDEQVVHHLSIVTYSSDANVVLSLSDGVVDANYVSTFYPKINSLIANGGTHADYGLRDANTQLATVTSTDEAKVVLFFTDGNPGTSGNWATGTRTGNEVANLAIGYAKSIKDAGGKIYSVTVQDIGVGDTAYKYLTLVSSAYPNATQRATNSNWVNNYPATRDADAEARYYSQATNASALDAVFSSISRDISTETVPDLDQTTQLRDVISEDFVLPVGAEKDNIKVYTQNCTFTDGQTFSFESSRVLFADAKINWSKNDNGEQVVNVANFSFKDNWCGMDDDEQHLGKKLILEITIELNPDSEGGLVTTNGPGSGVYINGTRVEPFVVVPATVYADRAITVKKTGMEPGETAIFTVTNTVTNQTWTVMLVAGANGVGIAELKVPVTYYEDNQEKFYSYDIAEKNDWSWNFTDSAALTNQQLYVEVAGQDTRQPNFEFVFSGVNNSKDSLLHGSVAAENVFEYNGPAQTESVEETND